MYLLKSSSVLMPIVGRELSVSIVIKTSERSIRLSAELESLSI